MSTEFNAPYHFKQNNLVVLKHHHGKYVRVNPDKLSDADGNGGTGQFAKWHCELEGDLIKLKNDHTGKYLRIWQNGRDVDVDGAGGPFTLFKVHVVDSPNVVKLESERFVGRYVAVTERDEVIVGEGGQHCVITFFREGNEMPQFQQQQQQQQQHHHQQQEDFLKHQKEELQKQHHQVEQKVEEHNLSEDVKFVKKWLESIQMTQYFETFIRNGFDRLSSVGVITESDLEKMNIALGHRKVLLAAAHLAPYAGKLIALRSLNYDTYVSGHKIGHGKDDTEELGAHKVLDDECIWVCNQIEEGKMTLKNEKHGGYLRVPKIIDKEACTQHEVDNRCELQITLVPAHPGAVAIFCPSNGNYLSCKEPTVFGKSTITCKPHVGKQECFTLIIR